MNLLAFDTSTDTLSIAVQRGNAGGAAGDGAGGGGDAPAVVWQHSGPGGALASAALIPAILKLMQEAGLAFAELDAIVFGRGPGSFTALRTACSVAQGLAFGANVPVLPVDSLLAVAEEARFLFAPTSQASPARVIAMLDARMDEMYLGCYEFDSSTWSIDETCSLIKPEALAGLAIFSSFADAAALPGAPATLLAGNVFTAYANRLPASALPRIFALPTAGSLLRLAPQLLRAGLAVPADQALPLYIRDKVAKTTEERLLEKSASAVAAAV